MAARKPVINSSPLKPELARLLARARESTVSSEELMEQRVSFAYGNAPEGSSVTRETARGASTSARLLNVG